MKVLVFVKATRNSEKGVVTDQRKFSKMLADMGTFNELLVKAGIMQEADGLKPSSAGKRLKFKKGKVSVIDGPFAETKELVAGYWVWNVKSMDEAVEWAKRCPNPMPGDEGVLEIRPTFSAEEFDALVASAAQRPEKAKSRRARSKAKSKK